MANIPFKSAREIANGKCVNRRLSSAIRVKDTRCIWLGQWMAWKGTRSTECYCASLFVTRFSATFLSFCVSLLRKQTKKKSSWLNAISWQWNTTQFQLSQPDCRDMRHNDTIFNANYSPIYDLIPLDIPTFSIINHMESALSPSTLACPLQYIVSDNQRSTIRSIYKINARKSTNGYVNYAANNSAISVSIPRPSIQIRGLHACCRSLYEIN